MRTSDDLWDSLAWMEAVERKEVLCEALDSLLVTQFTEAKVEGKNRLGEKVCALADRGDDFLRQVACSGLDLLVEAAFWQNQKVLLGHFLDWAQGVESSDPLREQANLVKRIFLWIRSDRCQTDYRCANKCLEKEFLATFDLFMRFSVTDVGLYEQMCTASVTDGAGLAGAQGSCCSVRAGGTACVAFYADAFYRCVRIGQGVRSARKSCWRYAAD